MWTTWKLGLFIGKPVGITVFSLAGIYLNIASFPTGMGIPHLITVGFLGGIGFTMSLFLINLSLEGTTATTAKLTILMVSASASLVGALMMRSFPLQDPDILIEQLQETSPKASPLKMGIYVTPRSPSRSPLGLRSPESTPGLRLPQ
ncbi:hypothetical protein CYMTET_47114 [Cymbomonas tetramitiformis]|uniref:Uncharacterized protein n=1 Tax=Cymbomonas tetramitiformis TaxID=36881 RepID=A0AAE0EWV9_9CHLO|nr:hypothetical protein CYMTET_47114 [Cymbomonas tetramitiformis]